MPPDLGRSRMGVSPRTWRAVIALQVLFVLAAVVLLALAFEDQNAAVEIGSATGLLYTIHAFWAFASWRVLTKRWVDGYSLFLLSTTLFSGGQIILEALGLLPDGLLDGRFDSYTLTRSVALVTACVPAMHLGAIVMNASRGSGLSVDSIDDSPNVSRLHKVGLAFIAISVIPTAMRAVEMATIVARSGYFGLYQQDTKIGIDNWDAVLATFFLPGLLILMATKSRSKGTLRVIWLIGAANAALNMFLGARSVALMGLLPMIALHHELVSRIKTKWAVALGIGGLVLIPLVAELRTLTLEERLVSLRGGDQSSEVRIVSALKEMGGSLITVAHTINLVPQVRDFDDGAGYGRALLTVLPNLFWDIHPAVAAGTYSQWLMREVDPTQYQLGGGIGFSMVAEAYLNGSWPGAPAWLFLIGLLVGGLVRWSRMGGGVRIVVEAIVLSSILILPRGETAIVVRTVVWASAVPYLIARGYLGGGAKVSARVPYVARGVDQNPVLPPSGSGR